MTDREYRVALDDARPDLGGNVQGGDLLSWTPALWAALVRVFEPRTVLDVGCGEGHAVEWFRGQGLDARGIDGLPLNIENAVTPIVLHDLLAGPFVCPVDLVWSCEVAEHILPEWVDHFLDTLANGRVVAMTHAVPHQGGHHHVNCQPAEYWIERMVARGYRLSDLAAWREESARDGDTYFSRTGLVFTRCAR